MNKSLVASLLSLLALATACPEAGAAKSDNKKINVQDVNIDRDGKNIDFSMNLDAKNLRPGKDREYWITPVIISADGADSIALQPVIVAGHNVYYEHLRENDLGTTPLYRGGKQDVISYSERIPYAGWFDNSRLKFDVQERNCCDYVTYEQPYARISHTVYTPVFDYINPVADSVKVFEINKRAYINFPVNRTELYPNYMNNPAELAKITGTIDSVRMDPDITITSISIKGFASPEGSYTNNVRLAKGRTATLKDYVESLYKFQPGFIKTSYEPEDWQGLEEYVVSSNLKSRDQILSLIRSDMNPDAKDARLRKDFPEQYSFLLASVYPRLRHSDYRIEYRVRSYTSLEEILSVLKTAPQKLSLNELYRAAQSMKPGSPEYNEVFEVAVRMYPDSEVANLNAANTAMGRGDYVKAEQYLNRAGDDPSVIYARGVLAALKGDYTDAEQWFASAARLKVADAPAALELVREVNATKGTYRLIPEE